MLGRCLVRHFERIFDFPMNQAAALRRVRSLASNALGDVAVLFTESSEVVASGGGCSVREPTDLFLAVRPAGQGWRVLSLFSIESSSSGCCRPRRSSWAASSTWPPSWRSRPTCPRRRAPRKPWPQACGPASASGRPWAGLVGQFVSLDGQLGPSELISAVPGEMADLHLAVDPAGDLAAAFDDFWSQDPIFAQLYLARRDPASHAWSTLSGPTDIQAWDLSWNHDPLYTLGFASGEPAAAYVADFGRGAAARCAAGEGGRPAGGGGADQLGRPGALRRRQRLGGPAPGRRLDPGGDL